jgi:hypothetical protein
MFRKTLAACICALSILSATSSAEARHHRHHRSAPVHDGRPAAWCGWWMRHQVGSDPGSAFNLARNWIHWGRRANGPAPGVIGVQPHHVFKVIDVVDHTRILAISGNDGHAVRTRIRSMRGVIAWRQS